MDIQLGMTAIWPSSHSYAVLWKWLSMLAILIYSFSFSVWFSTFCSFFLILSPPTSFFTAMWSPYCDSELLLFRTDQWITEDCFSHKLENKIAILYNNNIMCIHILYNSFNVMCLTCNLTGSAIVPQKCPAYS